MPPFRLKHSKTTFFAILFSMLSATSALFAAGGDYDSAYASGQADLAFASDSSAFYQGAYDADPTQANWDFWQGYVDGYTSAPQDYASIPTWPGAEPPAGPRTAVLAVVDDVISRQQTIQGTNRVAQSYRQFTQAISINRTTAADGLNSPSVAFDFSYADIDDQILGSSGYDVEGSILLSANLGDNVGLGLSYAKTNYRVKDVSWEQTTDFTDVFLSYQLTDNLSVAGFIDFSRTDIEYVDSFDRWGGGLLSSLNIDLGDHVDLGLTGVVSSMNKSSIAELGDDEDSAGLLMSDLKFWLSDNLSITGYGTYFALLDRNDTQTPIDGSYFTYGAEVGIGGPDMNLTVGYETIAADNYRDSERITAGVTFYF